MLQMPAQVQQFIDALVSAPPLEAYLVVGAFLFAIGMQLGGACASGTLFAVGACGSS